MDVQDIIEKAVLEMRLELGYRVSRRDRERLAHLRRYVEWRESLYDDQGGLQQALWGPGEFGEGT